MNEWTDRHNLIVCSRALCLYITQQLSRLAYPPEMAPIDANSCCISSSASITNIR